ncbi:MAG: hypothetical protein QGH94_13800 [Phycisphaerae bacterium]|nr:hypothetical protein [Phycisphaerae bacterium]MDP7289055.1 hypothetical protein [Phycisphaerae bacterium]
MNNTQNTTIVLLLVTAAILAAMLIPAFDDQGSVAYGDSSVRQGKYIMATGGYDENIDLIYIVNIETQKLCVYAPNLAKRTIDKMGSAVPLQTSSSTRR